jgi:hypothetical protein
MRGAVDLTGSPSAVCRLLDRPYDWRVRAVERIEMGSATSCVRRRSLLVAPSATSSVGCSQDTVASNRRD